MKLLTFALCYCLCILARGADARIWIHGTINEQSVRLALDTGADAPVLFRSAISKLKLKVTEPPVDFQASPGEIAAGFTEPCEFRFGTGSIRGQFRVVDVPPELTPGVEGVLGWSVLKGKIVSFDAKRQEVRVNDELPGNIGDWQKFGIAKGLQDLAFSVTYDSKTNFLIHVDTGDDGGVAIHPSRWEKLADNLTNQAYTLIASYYPATGVIVRKELWADELSVGRLTLKGVPVTVEAEEHVLTKTNFAARVGLYALRRIDLVADDKNYVAYVRPNSNSIPPYNHNRLGAVFVPPDTQSVRLLAHVAERSPAHAAGIRDGDELLKVDRLDATKWRTDPQIMPLSRFWEQPSGTILELTLRRGDQQLQKTVILKDIIGPGATAAAVK